MAVKPSCLMAEPNRIHPYLHSNKAGLAPGCKNTEKRRRRRNRSYAYLLSVVTYTAILSVVTVSLKQ